MDKELVETYFDMNWNYINRAKIVKRLQESEYDIVIIGGGITGAAVAREATLRGLNVAIVDKQDFSAGTSSRSSKLAHGGIRYLAYSEMELVKEATTERNWLRAHIPHLIRPIPFLFIHWEDGKDRKSSIKAGVKLYDFLSDDKQVFKNYKKHSWHTPEEIGEMEPEMRKDGNLGGAVYYDTNVDDARLTIESIKEAVVRGADALNYCEVIDYLHENDKIIGVKCKDSEINAEIQIKGKLIVNATGIWTDELVKKYPDDIPEPLIRPTKGVHLVYKRKDVRNQMATIIRSITDNRAFFILPRGDYSLIGTTDTDYDGDLASPFCNKDDADYLITSVQHYFPKAKLGYENILSTYAGIRPLVMQKGKPESEISRQHLIFFSEDGLLTITGGKLTTCRKMAEDLFEEVEKRNLFSNIKREPNFSKQKFLVSIDKQIILDIFKDSNINLDEKIVNLLYQQYGRGTLEILSIIKENGNLKKRIVENCHFIEAEILYILRNELTPHLIDVFCRRTEMALYIYHADQRKAVEKVASLMASEYSWNDEEKIKEIELYMEYIKKTVEFIT